MRRHFAPASAAIALVVLTSAFPLSAGIVKQVTDAKDVSFDWPMPNGDGSEIFVATSSNDGGGNPNHLFRIVAYDTTTGVGTPITSFPASLVHLRHNVSVTDDGQWLAFISNGDLVPGQNPTRADQAFSIKRDGTSLTQVTHITGPNGGGVIRIAMAGTADRVMVATSADLTGGNPQRTQQVFVMKRDGSNLIQVTNAPSGSINHLWISDDGNRIAFNHTGDLTGGNPDHNNEVFAITVGDALPRQITSSTVGESDSANISGDGTTIVFESTADYSGGGGLRASQIYAADWTTGAITQVTHFSGAHQPWPTNDGSEIVFAAEEVYKIHRDGTNLTQLTNIGAEVQHPVVSGNGSHFGVWLDNGLYSGLGSSINTRQLIQRSIPTTTYPEMSTDGQKACLWSQADLTGANPNHVDQIFFVNTDGTGLRQLTNVPPGRSAVRPAINGAGTRVYYEANDDPLGTNADHNIEVFGINSDGTGLIQYTNCTTSYIQGYVSVSEDGNTIVFLSFCNLTGGNPGGAAAPLFKVKPNGTALTQINTISAPAGQFPYFYYPRMDQTANWMAFGGNANINGGNPNNNFEIFRQRTNGLGFQQLTNYFPYASIHPDISGDASKIVFQSQADPLGQNADHNYEIFLYQPDAIPALRLRQLTATTKSSSEFPRISRDGRYVYFTSGAEFMENDPDHAFVALYRYDLNTNTIQRSGGLSFENTQATLENSNARWQPGVSPDGSKVIYSTFSDSTGANPDEYWDVEFLDYNAPNPPVISAGPAPTTVSFGPEPGMVRYDIIRGSVANLHNAGSTVDMGAVTCLKDDSGDTSTAGYPDWTTPASGQVFFYVFRGTMGSAAGPGSYGTGTAGERVASSGDCNP